MEKEAALKRIKDEIVKILNSKEDYKCDFMKSGSYEDTIRNDAIYYLERRWGHDEYVFLDVFLAEHDMYILFYDIEELKDILYNRVEPEWDNEEGIYIIPERDIVIPNYY